MNNIMISFERRVSPLAVNSPLPSTSQPAPISLALVLFLLNQTWCNFCDDHHDEKTCEVMKENKEKIFGKKQLAIANNSSINSLD